MRLSQPYLSALRVAVGFVLAPAIGVVAFGYISEGSRFSEVLAGKPLGFVGLFLIVAYAQTAFLGLPTYFLLNHSVKPTVTNAAIAGMVIAIFPWVFVTIATYQLMPTGWELVRQLALSGLIAGAAFWLCVAWRNPNFDLGV